MQTLLEQNTSSMLAVVKVMFENLQKEVKEIRTENLELRRSLEFSQNEIDALKKLHSQDAAAISKLECVEETNKNLLNRVRMLEDGEKKENLRITGLTEDHNETDEQTQVKVQKMITESLKVGNVKVKTAFRAGPKITRSSGPRPIIAKLFSTKDKLSCFRASSALKGTNIYVSEDVSKATLEIRKQKSAALKEKRDQGLIAYFSGIDIVTKPKRNVLPRNQSDDADTGKSSPNNSMENLDGMNASSGTSQPIPVVSVEELLARNAQCDESRAKKDAPNGGGKEGTGKNKSTSGPTVTRSKAGSKK